MSHTVWEQWSKLALLGIDRQQQAPQFTQQDALAQTFAALYPNNAIPKEREHSFLASLGILAQYRQAGMVADVLDAQGLEADSATYSGSYLSKAALNLLARILTEPRLTGLLEEWVALAMQKGLPAQPASLPFLLEQAQSREALRPALSVLLGSRGQWLLPFVPHSPVPSVQTETANEDDWLNGELEQRLNYLSILRQTEPSAARDALQAVWKKENAKTRERLLSSLRTGLSASDEAFLESCLTDRSSNVQEAARQLLAQLPDSAFSQRHKARLQTWWRVESYKKLLMTRWRIVVNLPEEWHKDWLRDGLEEKSPQSSLGNKAYWLQQSLSYIPVDYWLQAGQCEPNLLLECLKGNDWKDALLQGWELSVSQLGCSNGWALALLRHQRLDTSHRAWQYLDDAHYQSLWQSVISDLPSNPKAWVVLDQLSYLDVKRPLPLLWREVLEAVSQQLRKNSPPTEYHQQYMPRRVLSLLALRLPARYLPDYQGLLSQTTAWDNLTEDARSLLSQRLELLKVFAQKETQK